MSEPAAAPSSHRAELEAAVVSGLLAAPAQTLDSLRGMLGAQDFECEQARTIFEAALRVAGRGEPIEDVAIWRELSRNGARRLFASEGDFLEWANPLAAPTSPTTCTLARRLAELSLEERRRRAAAAFERDPSPENLAALREALAEEPAGPKLASWSDLATSTATMRALVEGVLHCGTLSVLAGEGATGKTFIALELARAVASGGRFLGHFEVQETGSALYLDAEAGESLMADRVRALGGGDPDVRFAFFPRIQLGPGVTELRPVLRELRPKLLVLDSLGRFLPDGADENANSDCLAALAPLRELAVEFDLAALVVHHFRKTAIGDNRPGQRVRGASAIRDVADAVYTIALNRNGDRVVTPDKIRAGLPIPAFRVAFDPNPDGGLTLTYAGTEEEDEDSKTELAAAVVMSALGEGRQTRRSLVELVRAQGVSERTLKRALRQLAEDGWIERELDGKEAVYVALR